MMEKISNIRWILFINNLLNKYHKMAKKWFTSFPDVYYMKQLRKGGRNELVFTFLGILNKKKEFSS